MDYENLFEEIINLKRKRTRYKNLYFKWKEKYEMTKENTVDRIFYEYKYKLYLGKYILYDYVLKEEYGV